MVPPTSNRVESATSDVVNRKIYQSTIDRLSKTMRISTEERSGLIASRLEELDHEWDMERLLEFNASSLMILTGFLSVVYTVYWLILTFAIVMFLCQHAVQGWCPPVPIFRSVFGIRTSVEILSEKVALKILRGDFNRLLVNQFMDSDDGELSAEQLLNMADLHCEPAQLIKAK